MFPDDELSDTAYTSGFPYPVKTLAPEDLLQDWEMGGIALNDPSQGLEVHLWHFTLEIDADTGHGYVFVEAPGTGKLPLIDGMDITEVSGAFDQNMNPFVAYIQDGDAKIWWWDSTLNAMTHTTLPGGCIDLRCTLDDKRTFNVGESDIVLCYVRGGDAYFTYQRDRYEVEQLLRAGISRLIYVAMNAEWRLQWKGLGADGSLFTDPFLGDILYDLCRQAGYEPENIDVAECYDPLRDRVPGILIDTDQGLDIPVGWLMDMFQVYRVDSGKKTKFKKMGGPVVARIPFNKLLEDYPKTLKKTDKDRLKLPRGIQLNHIDPDAGFAKNMQRATRRSNMAIGDAMKTMTTKVVLTADQAANAAWRILKKAHNELCDFEFSTRLEYTYLEPGDVVEVEDSDGTWYRMHLQERNEDDGNIKWEAETDGGYLVYDSAAPPGKQLDPPVSSTPGTIGDTELDIFNEPIQNSLDDELVLYIAARGEGSGWNGYRLYFSPDGVIPYSEVATFDRQANIGETVTAVTDVGTAVEVLLPEPVESVTADQLAAGFNRFFIGDEEVQVLTATLLGMVGELYHYSLTGMVRGVLHTPKEAWSAGVRFAEVNADIFALQIPRQYYGTELHYKAVSFGQTLDEVGALLYDFDFAWSQYEFPVTNVVVTAATPGVTVTWDGSPRLGTFGPSPFHSKYMRGYRVKFSDGHTIDTLEETVTYAAGLMGTVVEVRALNEITGEGPLADGEGAVDPGDIPGFLFSGSFTDGYVGEPLEQWSGEGFTASGGFWDANARGFVVPGVGIKCYGSTNLSDTRALGIPHEDGTFTSMVEVNATSPDPLESGTAYVNQSVTIYPRRSYGALDTRFKQHAYAAQLQLTTPPLKQYEMNGACTFFFYGVTTGQVIGQFRVTDSTNAFIVGISNSKGELTIGDYSVAIGPFGDASYYLGQDAVYSIELDADETNPAVDNYWIYEDTGSGPVEVKSGHIPLPVGNQYRICLTSEYIQAGMIVEANGGNEAWYTTPTQVGFTGVPVPATPIPLAWGYVFPDYGASFTGGGWLGANYADDFTGTPVIKSNAEYSTGKHRWQMHGGFRNGICVAAFDNTSGQLGDPSTPDSVGVGRSLVTAGSYTIHRCFGGVYTASEVVVPAPYSYPQTIFALDADGDTLKICAMDATGTNVLVLDTINLPSGQSWRAAASGGAINCDIKFNPPGPAGYANAVCP